MVRQKRLVPIRHYMGVSWEHMDEKVVEIAEHVCGCAHTRRMTILAPEVREWLKANMQHGYKFYPGSRSVGLYDDQDAVLYRMRWSD